MAKYVLIDGNSIANRAFYALPFLSNHEGKPSGAVFGFANILIKMILEVRPTHVIVAFDHSRQTFRRELYTDYKAQRKNAPEELIEQFPIIKKMLEKMSIKTFELNNIEADDIIGTISHAVKEETIILSGDRDLLQLLDKHVSVWLTKKGVTEVVKVTPENLSEVFPVKKPEQVVEIKALMGDSSDNIPGVKGIGEKTAQSLIEKYDNIENLYQHIEEISGKLHEKLIEGKEMAFLSRQLATIKTDCEIPFSEEESVLSFPFKDEVFKFFQSMDFSSLIKNQMLFESSLSEVKQKEKAKMISLTDKEINTLLETKFDTFAYSIEKMQFSFKEGEIFFLEKNYSIFGSPLSLEEGLVKLKPIFENPDILKLTFSAKSDMHFLERLGIKLNNFFDLSLAQYVAHAGIKAIEEADIGRYYQLKKLYSNQINQYNLNYVYENIEYPLIDVLKRMEDYGFKINEEKLDELDEFFNSQIEELTKQIYIEADEQFNLNSPKQVANILFDKLGIEAWNNKKRSTSFDKLDELRYIPIVEHILHYRKLSKIKNTYIDVYKNICRNEGDIIHTTFNQTLTSTGRLSSSEPNLQNIPTRADEGREIRKIFISKFKGGKIISADYNQIELRLLAHMSEEKNLIEAYRKGEDIHTLTASQIFDVPAKEVSLSMRRDAKAVNFGIIYGISDYGLSQNIKTSRKSAKEYIDTYFTRYPSVKTFMDKNIEYARQKGYIRTMFGRIRRIPEISSAKYLVRAFGERVAMNMPLQGTASDIIKLAMLRVDKRLRDEGFISQLILQIHDELIIDTFEGEEDRIVKILKDEMENIVKLSVPLSVNISIGENLFDCK